MRGQDGIVVELRDGPELIFGDATRVRAKWVAATRVLADPDSEGATYIDVRLPGRPAAGGLPAATLAPVAPAGSEGQTTPQATTPPSTDTVDPATEPLAAPPATQPQPAAPETHAANPGAERRTRACARRHHGRRGRLAASRLSLNHYLRFTPTLDHAARLRLHNFLRGRLTLSANSA